MVWPPLERVREVTNRPWKFGPPSGGHGDSAPAGGLSSRDAPPVFFSDLRKRKRAVHGPKEKTALVATLHMRAKLLYGGRRIGACSDLALPSGTLYSSARTMLPSRGGWCGGRRGARTHLTSSSFRAFRFATRCPVLAEAVALPYAATLINHRPAAAEIGAGCILVLPRAKGFPQGPGVSVSDFYKAVPTFPRRRQEGRIYAARPAEHFFFSTGRGAFSF